MASPVTLHKAPAGLPPRKLVLLIGGAALLLVLVAGGLVWLFWPHADDGAYEANFRSAYEQTAKTSFLSASLAKIYTQTSDLAAQSGQDAQQVMRSLHELVESGGYLTKLDGFIKEADILLEAAARPPKGWEDAYKWLCTVKEQRDILRAMLTSGPYDNQVYERAYATISDTLANIRAFLPSLPDLSALEHTLMFPNDA